MENRDELTREVPSLDDEGVPDHLDPLPAKRASGDGQEGLPPPNDLPGASLGHGTTEREQREGEPLDDRLGQEEPDATAIGDWSGDRRIGRLVEDDEENVDAGPDPLADAPGAALADTEGSAVAERLPEDVHGMTAEEAAMHIEDAPR